MAEEIKDGVHNYTGADGYIPPQNAAVAEHLKWFSGLKLGLMMHWSPATQLGTYESWPLCDGDADWSQTEIDWTGDMDEFRMQYWDLNRTFNPIRFQPEQLADMAVDCGFKYLLFTTKHHDGFCMFDTATTDYKITSPDCPFSTNRYANVTKSLFDAFRARGLAISAYFSKPDWHSDAYWHREFGLSGSRNVNYDVSTHPELWSEFVAFTHKQLVELTSEYGKIDVLWLDGGWVRPSNLEQDIRLGTAVEHIRATTQPHLIVCDRTVGGEYENIVTPEQTIPDHPLDIPWEACISLGKYFSFHYEDQYKSAREIAHTLLDIVSKGGSLALNITLRPDGAVPPQVVAVLHQLGRWLRIHGAGIYESRPCAFEPHEGVVYTQSGSSVYAYVLFDDMPRLPRRLFLRADSTVSSVRLLRTQSTLPFERNGDFIVVDCAGVSMLGAEYADCLVLE